MRALDSFNIDVDGAPVTVAKGEILPAGHPVLTALGADVPNLFRPLAEDEPPPPAPAKTSRPARRAGS